MEKKKSNKISWSTIYSLGLVPAILVWGLAPSLKENVIVLIDYRRYYMDYILPALHTFLKDVE